MADIAHNASWETITARLKALDAKADTPEEKEALRIAAMGLFFIYLKNQWQEFRQISLESDTPLSGEQIKHLRSLGLRP